MNLPIQSQPVMRTVSIASVSGLAINPSIDCNAACGICNANIPFVSQASCVAALAGGCHC
jgi:hypothetical protein